MAKLTLHFKNQEEFDAYWQGETPGSKFLCIIDSVNVDESGQQTISNVLITSSNNNQTTGKDVEMGTAAVEAAQEFDDVIEIAEKKTEDILGRGIISIL